MVRVSYGLAPLYPAAEAAVGIGGVAMLDALAIADPDLLEGVSGERLTGVPAVREQLQLIHDQVLPALGVTPPRGAGDP